MKILNNAAGLFSRVSQLVFGFRMRSAVGESYGSILRYFFPEFITCLILYCLIGLIDSVLIAQLPGKVAYTTLGYTNTLFHLITKIAEGFSVGMVVLCGQYNGAKEFKKTGEALADGFWATALAGGVIALLLYASAPLIYAFYQVPEHMIALGVPFMRLRAIGVFFNFIFFAFIGFLRGIKNTRVPMILFICGSIVFLFFDYVLLFGKWGFPELSFNGSALASVIQYIVMFAGALGYVLYNQQVRIYCITLLRPIRWKYVATLMQLSWPVMLDKATLAVCQIWLSKQISVVALSHGGPFESIIRMSFVAIKDLERFALVPALALAQIITFLVSNDLRTNNSESIYANVKRVTVLSLMTVGIILLVITLYPTVFLRYIDTESSFVEFASSSLAIVSLLVVFDVVQLILSAVLRGAAKVQVVMWSRIALSMLFFIPVSYVCAHTTFMNPQWHFIAVYGAIFAANALNCIWYFYWLKNNKLTLS